MISKENVIEKMTKVVGADGTTQVRETLAAASLAKGDVLKLVDVEEVPVGNEGRSYIAAKTADGQLMSFNNILRRGNGIAFGTNDLAEATGKVYDKIASDEGLTLTIAKVFRSETNYGPKNNYRFNAIQL